MGFYPTLSVTPFFLLLKIFHEISFGLSIGNKVPSNNQKKIKVMYPTTTKFRQCAKPANALNLFFDDFPIRDFVSTNFKQHGSWPAANVKENKENFFIELASPGMEKADFNIQLEGDTLTISAERKQDVKEENERYTRKEFQYGKFTRSFALPETVNTESIGAVYEKGVLHITLPKKAEVVKESARNIQVV